uniref:Transmembrane 9 superfamily member n=1 Tax=Lygus hesperus TaxID=30085 RepID=A0A0K8SHL3_LYGHE
MYIIVYSCDIVTWYWLPVYMSLLYLRLSGWLEQPLLGLLDSQETAIASNQMYYMFGFLFLVFLSLVITCSETTILLCYFHLCAEDYHWWWRSFLTSGFTAMYLFVYCIHYFVTKLNIEDVASTFLYFGYTLIMVFLFFLLTGTIGFFACFWFVRKIYSVVKVD